MIQMQQYMNIVSTQTLVFPLLFLEIYILGLFFYRIEIWKIVHVY